VNTQPAAEQEEVYRHVHATVVQRVSATVPSDEQGTVSFNNEAGRGAYAA